jgi:hypothetical protein
LAHWLRGAFAFVYTRASVVVTPLYLLYHLVLVLVPVLHVAALTLFATSDKRGYKRADVKITYVVLRPKRPIEAAHLPDSGHVDQLKQLISTS